MGHSPSGAERGRSAYLVCYALYVLLIGLSVAAIFIWRPTIIVLIRALFGRSYAETTVFYLCMLALGFGLFVMVMGAEPYLRGGIRRRQVVRRFWRLAIPLGILIALAPLLLVWANSRLAGP